MEWDAFGDACLHCERTLKSSLQFDVIFDYRPADSCLKKDRLIIAIAYHEGDQRHPLFLWSWTSSTKGGGGRIEVFFCWEKKLVLTDS
jgi:hypothetical protein